MNEEELLKLLTDPNTPKETKKKLLAQLGQPRTNELMREDPRGFPAEEILRSYKNGDIEQNIALAGLASLGATTPKHDAVAGAVMGAPMGALFGAGLGSRNSKSAARIAASALGGAPVGALAGAGLGALGRVMAGYDPEEAAAARTAFEEVQSLKPSGKNRYESPF